MWSGADSSDLSAGGPGSRPAGCGALSALRVTESAAILPPPWVLTARSLGRQLLLMVSLILAMRGVSEAGGGTAGTLEQKR
jgi:hypothetical protein